MKPIQVTCAIIKSGAKVLAVQRSEKMKLPLKWEFPGGKIEPNETEEDCIKREIREELNIEIEVVKKLTPSIYEYSDFAIQLIPFIANHTSGAILLKEHKQFSYFEKEQLIQLDWAEADIPILEELLNQ